MRVTGLRGVGKTVLLGAFSEHAEDANWEPAELAAPALAQHR